MGVDVSFSGMGDLIDQLESMVANAAKVENDALKAAMQPIIEEAQQTSAFHDRTGQLRASLAVGKVQIKAGRKFILGGTFGKGGWYGRMVEFGTSRAAPHPFLQPAFNHHEKEAEEIIAARIREALNV